MRHPGPLIKNRREKPKYSYGVLVKGLAKAMGKDILPDIEMPKPTSYQPRPNARHKHIMRERIIEKRIIAYLRGKGYKCGKTTPETGGWNVGCPDIVCYAKSLWYIEVKTPKGKQSPEQIEFQKMCESIGIKYIVARSVRDVWDVR